MQIHRLPGSGGNPDRFSGTAAELDSSDLVFSPTPVLPAIAECGAIDQHFRSSGAGCGNFGRLCLDRRSEQDHRGRLSMKVNKLRMFPLYRYSRGDWCNFCVSQEQAMRPANSKPILSAWQICKICLGALASSSDLALPQANATRIFRISAPVSRSVPLLWLAGRSPDCSFSHSSATTPIGPGRASAGAARTFLVGAALAAATLIAMPNATTLWMAVLVAVDSRRLTRISRWGRFALSSPTRCRPSSASTGYLMYMFFASVGAVGRQPAALGDGVDLACHRLAPSGKSAIR